MQHQLAELHAYQSPAHQPPYKHRFTPLTAHDVYVQTAKRQALDTAPRVSTAKVPLHPVEELLASMKATDPNILQEVRHPQLTEITNKTPQLGTRNKTSHTSIHPSAWHPPHLTLQGSLLALVDQYINCLHLESGCKAFLDALAATLVASTQPLPASAEDLALILVLLSKLPCRCVQCPSPHAPRTPWSLTPFMCVVQSTARRRSRRPPCLPLLSPRLFKVLAAVRFDDQATHKVHFEAFASEQLSSCLNTACTVHGIDFEVRACETRAARAFTPTHRHLLYGIPPSLQTIVEIHEAALLICLDLPVLRQYNAYFKARTSRVNCGGA